MLEVRELRKCFGNKTAVDGISFRVEPGTIFGLLGPNGAGKSTTIAMMVGITKPDSGTVTVADGSPTDASVRNSIGIAPQSLAIYEDLSAEENLRFCARLYGLSKAEESERVAWALNLAGLGDRRTERSSRFSGGMKRRLNLACALVHHPKVVFLDEPTVGVDPQSRNFIFDAIERLRDEGLTVLYTTHYMEEAERLCDQIAIMDNGRILASGSLTELTDRYGGGSLVVAELSKVPDDFAFAGGTLEESTLRVETSSPFETVAQFSTLGLPIRRLRIERPDLESVFLSLTGRSLRD